MITNIKFTPTKEVLSEIFSSLKEIFNVQNVSTERKTYIQNLVKEFGYLPFSHQQALEELTPAETLIGIEQKLIINNVYNDDKFAFESLSPVTRAGITDSEWIKREQHNIKLLNLAGLGNGNVSDEAGLLIDWLKQTLTLPAGNLKEGVLSTTAYFIPFHPRDFGCAYIPTDSGVSQTFEDKNIYSKLGLNAKEQIQLYFALTQLCGHPTMYDVLPQTGRFSKTVLANAYAARWFDVKELISQMTATLEIVGDKLQSEYSSDEIAKVKEIISKELKGEYLQVEESLTKVYTGFQELLKPFRAEISNKMMTKEQQEIICAKATELIASKINKSVDAVLTEDDITCQGEVIGELVGSGLWPAPGGAWCSSGVAIFEKMSEGAGYPIFKHYDVKGEDVTHFANLDCQTPYYFVYFEKGEYNQKVIDFYMDFLKKLQNNYNFDGFRVDHIDHIVDEVSQTAAGIPISYRAPSLVLGESNRAIKKACPHFATLAEYMLWDNFYKEYHQDMSFDILWGNDIISQFQKTPKAIAADNKYLAEYNSTVPANSSKLSVIKTYNNQDGEFSAIDQYPAQLGAKGALFKFFKFKFMPGGNLAQRPVMFIDGDEAFNKTGIEKAIGFEGAMKRENNLEFFKEFNAIINYALHDELTLNGCSEVLKTDEDGFVMWQVSKDGSNEVLLIAANQNPETEKLKTEDGVAYIKEYEAVVDKAVEIPSGYSIIAEICYDSDKAAFVETSEIRDLAGAGISLKTLAPSEYRIYRFKK
ncbi:MAG: hypothetical protein WCK67_01325 [bacterium]